MIAPRTKRIFLTPISSKDFSLLYEWRNSQSFRDKCSHRREPITAEEFRTELEKDFARDRHEQYMICRRSDKLPVGTIFSYGLNRLDGYVFVTTFLKDDYVGSGFGVEAFVLFATHLVQKLCLFKIYTDVYEYNLLSMKTLLKWGFKEEGRFKQHRVYRDRRWDMVRLAVYATDLNRVLEFGKRLGAEEEKETV